MKPFPISLDFKIFWRILYELLSDFPRGFSNSLCETGKPCAGGEFGIIWGSNSPLEPRVFRNHLGNAGEFIISTVFFLFGTTFQYISDRTIRKKVHDAISNFGAGKELSEVSGEPKNVEKPQKIANNYRSTVDSGHSLDVQEKNRL